MTANPYAKVYANDVASLCAGADGVVAWVALTVALTRQGTDEDAARSPSGSPLTAAELAEGVGLVDVGPVERGLATLIVRRRIVREGDGAYAIRGWARSQLSQEARKKRRQRDRARDMSPTDPRDAGHVPARGGPLPAPAPAPALFQVRYSVKRKHSAGSRAREPWGTPWPGPLPAQPWSRSGLAAPLPAPRRAGPAVQAQLVDPGPKKRKPSPKPKPAVLTEHEQAADRVISHMNARRKSIHPPAMGFDLSRTNRREIVCRLRDGVPEALLIAAVDARADLAAERGPESSEYRYLTPSTPFRASNWAASLTTIEQVAMRRGSSRVATPDRAPPVIDGELATDEERMLWLDAVKRSGRAADGHSAVLELRSARSKPRAMG